MMFNWILIILTFMASGYSLSLMCILRCLRRDPRPAAMSVFVLLAQGIMHMTVVLSKPTQDYADGWLIVWVATILLICWLVVISTRIRKQRKGKQHVL